MWDINTKLNRRSIGIWANLNQNADIILNEVGTTNRSVLNGALEVFGQNAAVVIANPNDFDCNGCSFINTSKLTMVSGQSQVSDGAITGFKINNDLIPFSKIN